MKQKRIIKGKVKIILFVILGLVVLLGLYFGYSAYKKSDLDNITKIVEKIDTHEYYLEEDAPKQFKELFGELTKVLKQENYSEEVYAKLVSQLLAVDFYNIENKISKNDIGGVQFIYEPVRENFVLESSETVYKYVENNLDGKRKQDLPKVVDSSVTSITDSTYSSEYINDSIAFLVNVKLTYDEDLGYPTNIAIKLVHVDDKLEVVEME
jgi:hypothetical protein